MVEYTRQLSQLRLLSDKTKNPITYYGFVESHNPIFLVDDELRLGRSELMKRTSRKSAQSYISNIAD